MDIISMYQRKKQRKHVDECQWIYGYVEVVIAFDGEQNTDHMLVNVRLWLLVYTVCCTTDYQIY